MTDTCFFPFLSSPDQTLIPDQINDPFAQETPKICKIAAFELQKLLSKEQQGWKHNFGLTENKKGAIKGKMFGVLVVEKEDKQLGYLCTFSGKLDDKQHPSFFVPSIFDISSKDHFLTKGMTELTRMGARIKTLKNEISTSAISEVKKLKDKRRGRSVLLQQEIFEQYNFLNKAGNLKSLNDIFKDHVNKKPASGAGECAAPKLLQFAYEHKMKTIAIAEFWWGVSTRGEDKKHGHFYPACNDKCKPILGWMLAEDE